MSFYKEKDMRKQQFELIVDKIPNLTAKGINTNDLKGHEEFKSKAIYLQQTLDSIKYMSRFTSTTRTMKYQKQYATPEMLKEIIAWHSREVSEGAIIIAALYLGFRVMKLNNKVCFNIDKVRLELEVEEYQRMSDLRRQLKSA
jgi:hypothetical protein